MNPIRRLELTRKWKPQMDTDKHRILSYRDEQIGDALYGIRVAYTDNLVTQCYLRFKLCEPKMAQRQSLIWRLVQLFLIVLIAVVGMLLHIWISTR